MARNWGNTHLIIPDAHARPDVPNDRFLALGRLIMDVRPTTIVCLGDFGDFQSLSSYDKGKKSHEGQRYIKDVDATNDALRQMERPAHDYNVMRLRNKKSMYRPRKVFVEGNHEERTERAVQCNAELEGVMSAKDDINWYLYGWEYYDYQVPVEIDGIMYSHNFASGTMGRPIGGMHLAHSLLQKNLKSSTVGHDHRFDYKVAVRRDGQRIHGLSAGCFVDERYMDVFGFAKSTYHWWWSGVVIKKNVTDGDYDLETVPFRTLMKEYA